MLQETGEHDLSQNFSCHREKADATTVATFCLVTLLIAYKNNVGISPLLWETLGGPEVKDKIMRLLCKAHPPYSMTSAVILPGPAATLSLRLTMAFST